MKALLVALLLFPAVAEGATQRIAVVVGNNAGGGERALHFAERDASRVSELFRSLGGVDDVRLLLGQDASALRRELEQLASDQRSDTVLLFFYSGHADDHGLMMGGSHFGFDELRSRLQDLPARIAIAFIDACQAGRVARMKGGKAVPVVDVRFEDNKNYRGRIFLTSSAAGERSQETDELEASYFTHYLVSALRGAADLSGDRQVSLDETYQYVYRHTLARTSETLSGPQHPVYDVDLTGQGELILTRLQPGESTLVLQKDSEGTYVVRQGAGSAVAEVMKARGQVVRIALVPGSYAVERTRGDVRHAKDVALQAHEELVLDERDMRSLPMREGSDKGGAAPPGSVLLGYEARTGYLDDAELMHGVRFGWSYELPVGNFELGMGYAYDGYRRADGISVGLHDVLLSGGLSGRLALIGPVGGRLGVELGVGPVWQVGTEADGTRRQLSSFRGMYRGRAGIDVAVAGGRIEVMAAAGQTLVRRGEALAMPVELGVVAGIAWELPR